MRPIIQEITLSKPQVLAILEDWLNTDVLYACPHRILDVSQYEADENDGRFSLVLAPAPAPEIIAFDDDFPEPVAVPTNGNGVAANGHNGNGHHSVAATAPAPQKEVPAVRTANGRKRGESKYDEQQRAEVIRLRYEESRKINDIIAATGIPESSVYGILADHRKRHGDRPAPRGAQSDGLDQQRAEIYRRYESGASTHDIAEALGLDLVDVGAIVARARRNGLIRPQRAEDSRRFRGRTCS